MDADRPDPGSALALSLTNGILLALITTVSCLALYAHFFYLPRVDPDYTGRLLREASQSLETHGPGIRREVVEVAEETWPLVEAAFVRQVRDDYPLLAQTLEREGSAYLTNIERAFRAKVKARYHEYLVRHRQILKSEFPEHATRQNVERVLAAFEATFDELVQRYYLDQFRHEAARTEKLWQAIPPARRPEYGQPSLEEQLAVTARNWLLKAMQTNEFATTNDSLRRSTFDASGGP
ncbi:MAG: hypothetical protein IT423_22825 [Pirellulaceae bacterium]|nr:hypothetical protein [Pirellulaceae bacterium]